MARVGTEKWFKEMIIEHARSGQNFSSIAFGLLNGMSDLIGDNETLGSYLRTAVKVVRDLESEASK